MKIPHYQYEELLKRVAWMYYEDGLNQQEIADRLRLSRTKVLRLLQECRSAGIVKVTIDAGIGLLFALEKELCRLARLDECFVVPSGEDPLIAVSKAMAYRFEEALRSAASIGLGGGRTLYSFARELDAPARSVTREVVSLVGNTKANLAVEPFEISTILAGKLNAEVYNMWAPARVDSPREAALIKSTPSIKTLLAKGAKVDIAFLGLGDMRNSSYVRYGYIGEKRRRELLDSGAVGEILGRFYDIDGVPIEKDYNQLCISVDMPMRNRVVGVAGGKEKFSAILGALKTGWLNGLITDEATADALVGGWRD